jgi:hypothetical protein
VECALAAAGYPFIHALRRQRKEVGQPPCSSRVVRPPEGRVRQHFGGDWFRLVAFGEAAEHLVRFGKGERIAVTGRLQSSSYTDREGVKRTSVEVVVLRSDDAPLPRKAQPEPEPPLPDAAAEPEAEAVPVGELVIEAAPKPRRRRKVAA